jgi:hypothetical protein
MTTYDAHLARNVIVGRLRENESRNLSKPYLIHFLILFRSGVYSVSTLVKTVSNLFIKKLCAVFWRACVDRYCFGCCN